MIDFKIDKISNFQILDINTLEPIAELSDINNCTIESEVETSSFANEKLSFNHYATLEYELTNCSSLFNYKSDFYNKPMYVEYYIPILIQARWHKKPRINKKWLKRYGMKKDNILVRCDVESISPNTNCDSYYSTAFVEYSITFGNMQYKFRPDQLRKNLKMTMCCD